MANKKREITKDFALIYAVGVAFLIVDGFMGGLYDLGVMNILSLLAALAVYMKL
jgi:hypothetical protein